MFVSVCIASFYAALDCMMIALTFGTVAAVTGATLQDMMVVVLEAVRLVISSPLEEVVDVMVVTKHGELVVL